MIIYCLFITRGALSLFSCIRYRLTIGFYDHIAVIRHFVNSRHELHDAQRNVTFLCFFRPILSENAEFVVNLLYGDNADGAIPPEEIQEFKKLLADDQLPMLNIQKLKESLMILYIVRYGIM